MTKQNDPIGRLFSHLDAFGTPITFRSNGSDHYSSKCGVVTTILITVVLIVYSVLKILAISSKADQSGNHNSGLLVMCDFLSAVGGLAFLLNMTGVFFVQISLKCVGKSSEVQLLKALYKRDPDFDGDTQSSRRSSSKRSPLRSIERRKGFSIEQALCGICRDQRQKKIIRKGMARTNHELEVSHFIKYQKFLRTIMRTLFSDMERFLIRNQYNTVLDSSSDSASGSSSGSDVDEHKFLNILREKDSIFTTSLLRGAFKRQGKHSLGEREELKGRKKAPKKEEATKLEDYEDEEVTLDQLVIERGQKRQWKSRPKRSQTNPYESQACDGHVLYEEPRGDYQTKQTLRDKKHYQVNAP